MERKWFRFNLFDVFLILLALLAGLSVYFTFFNPIQFSRLIHREDKMSYAEVEIILPDDLYWMKDVLKPGVERKMFMAHWTGRSRRLKKRFLRDVPG